MSKNDDQGTGKKRTLPPLDLLGPNQRKGLKRNILRESPRVVVKIADAAQVTTVIEQITAGKTVAQACSLAGVSIVAFTRRIRQDQQLAQDFAAAVMMKALDRADDRALDQVTCLAPFLKISTTVAGGYDRTTFGTSSQERMPPELHITTNLDFGRLTGAVGRDPRVIDIDALDIDALDFDQTIREAADAMDQLQQPTPDDDEGDEC